MANMSDFLENKLIDQIFRAQAYTFPGTLFFALCTTAPTDSSTGASIAEVTGGSYARQSVIPATNTFYSTNGQTTGASTGTGGTTSNVATISYPTATADWGTVVGILVTDSATTAAGNGLFWATLTANKVVGNGDQFQFSASTGISVQIDN
jgi:hypothetical protein